MKAISATSKCEVPDRQLTLVLQLDVTGHCEAPRVPTGFANALPFSRTSCVVTACDSDVLVLVNLDVIWYLWTLDILVVSVLLLDVLKGTNCAQVIHKGRTMANEPRVSLESRV